MNIFNRNNQVSPQPSGQADLEVRLVCGDFSARMDSIELRCLLYLLDTVHDSTSLATSKLDVAIPYRDHNLTTAIFEKCLAIKKKNKELKVRILNLRTSLTHQMYAQRRTGNLDHRYQEILDGIKQKSANLKRKLQQYKGFPQARCPFSNTELMRSQSVEELAEATEWLQRQLIKNRKDFDLVFKNTKEQRTRDF